MLTDDKLEKIESWAGRHSSPFAYSAGANIKETLQLVDDHRALSARVAALTAQLEAERKGHYESDLALRTDRDSIAKAFREMTADRDDEQKWATQYSQDVGKLEDANRALCRVMDGMKEEIEKLTARNAQLETAMLEECSSCEKTIEIITLIDERDAARKAARKAKS